MSDTGKIIVISILLIALVAVIVFPLIMTAKEIQKTSRAEKRVISMGYDEALKILDDLLADAHCSMTEQQIAALRFAENAIIKLQSDFELE